jgi:hypothetical protein
MHMVPILRLLTVKSSRATVYSSLDFWDKVITFITVTNVNDVCEILKKLKLKIKMSIRSKIGS